MNTVLTYVQPVAGHVFTLVPTLNELQSRGYSVTLATGPTMERFTSAAGIRRVDVTPEIAAIGQVGARPANEPLAALMLLYGEAAAADVERLIATERPDFLILDSLLWGTMIAAEASGLPWAAAAHSCVLLPTMSPRVVGPGLVPPRTALQRLRHALMARVGRRQADAFHLPLVNPVRKRRGLAPLIHADDGYCRAPLTLGFTAEPFEYPRTDWHPSVRLVGPSLWEAPAELAEAESWLDPTDDTPLVLVSTSSVAQNDDPLLEASLDGLADAPYQVIATAPAATQPARIPANARVVPFAPHGALLPRAACVVCHGGAGITHKALAAGVPVVVCPFGRDQAEIARRVEVAGAGVLLPRRELSADRLRSAVQEAVQRGPGAARVAEAFRRAGGATAAADAIDALLVGGPHGGQPAPVRLAARS